MPSPHLIIDACCFINLCASRCLVMALAKDSWKYWMTDVALGESLYLRDDDPENPGMLYKVQLFAQERAATAGIQIACLESEEESDWFVRMAQILDDGEAHSIAVAKCRGYRLGSDDQKALRWARHPDVGLVTATTPEIIRHWVEEKLVAENPNVIINNIEKYGRFIPRVGTPDCDWWNTQKIV